jgi:two-component system, NtrC family, nitrogen regulation response regulator NtrX
MKKYPWPGNVRELKNLLERLVIMTPSRTITREQLPLSESPFPTSAPTGAEQFEGAGADTFKEAREEFERDFLLRKLEENDWKISKTAEAIEMERSNLHRKIKSFGIELKK